jgi:hypothetical protein
MANKNSEEYDRFFDLASKVISAPRSEIKTKLDAEKQAKRRKKSRTSSASRVAGDKD